MIDLYVVDKELKEHEKKPHGGKSEAASSGITMEELNKLLQAYAKADDLSLYTLISPDHENVLDRLKKLERDVSEHDSLFSKWQPEWSKIAQLPKIRDDIESLKETKADRSELEAAMDRMKKLISSIGGSADGGSHGGASNAMAAAFDNDELKEQVKKLAQEV